VRRSRKRAFILASGSAFRLQSIIIRDIGGGRDGIRPVIIGVLEATFFIAGRIGAIAFGGEGIGATISSESCEVGLARRIGFFSGQEKLFMSALLFTPWKIREIRLRNRIGVSPMCQYWATDGFASDWHLVHLGSRAVGGAGLVMTEASAVEARGRITPADLGIWSDKHIPMLSRIADFIHGYGAVAGIQLAHAGRKGSAARPWEGGRSLSDEEGGWETVAPSPLAFGGPKNELWRAPRDLTEEEIVAVQAAFVSAAQRALVAGFRLVELHFAHGYLGHSFLSPITNQRTDRHGGLRTGFVLPSKQCIESGRSGLSRIPWQCGSPPLIGSMAAGTLNKPSSWRED
jgi:NADH:flavin oxidoreductase / NADH oxidase family